MRRALLLAASALAASCAAPERTGSPPPVTETTAAAAPSSTAGAPTYAEDLLAYLGRLRTLNESALGAEAARMKRDASDVARVKAALAMTLSTHGDDAEILELVEPVARRPAADRDVRAMAALLSAMANERKRLRQRAAAAAGELREERRAVETQKQRAEALQQKLDALTDLEKSLANRDTQAR